MSLQIVGHFVHVSMELSYIWESWSNTIVVMNIDQY